MPDKVQISSASQKQKAAEVSKKQTPERPEAQEVSAKDKTTPRGSVFTIANEKDASEIVGFLGAATRADRWSKSASLSWKADESCVPSRSSENFYAKRSARDFQLSRRSQLAVEVGQDQVTRQLVSSKFSASVAPSVIKLPKGAHATQRHSLRYPNIGNLDLVEFIGTEMTELDSDESSAAAGKEEEAADEEKK